MSYRTVGLLPVILSIMMTTGACSLDYSTGMEGFDQNSVPTLVFYQIEQTSVKQGRVAFQMRAAQAELFETNKKTRLTGFKFTEYQTNGEVGAQGEADLAEINTDTKNAQISGRISLSSQTEKSKLLADNLVWVNDDKILRSQPEATVTIERNANSIIQGQGFEVNFKTNQVQFTGEVQGSHSADDEKSED